MRGKIMKIMRKLGQNSIAEEIFPIIFDRRRSFLLRGVFVGRIIFRL